MTLGHSPSLSGLLLTSWMLDPFFDPYERSHWGIPYSLRLSDILLTSWLLDPSVDPYELSSWACSLSH